MPGSAPFPMCYSVVRLLAHGRPLSRAARARSVPVAGCLRIEEQRIEARGRWLRVARLVALDRQQDADLLPLLYEPQLVTMSPVAFTLAGFEVIDGAALAQMWLCREPGPLAWAMLQGAPPTAWTVAPGHEPAGQTPA